uniref:Uncharacterized protein n=1 Tax=Arundo donax TaxID=35708 RepID=A0A0A9DYT4_ARUDO
MGQPFNDAQSAPKVSMDSSFRFIAGGARPGMSLMFLLCGLTILTTIIAITPQTIRNRNAMMHLSVAT